MSENQGLKKSNDDEIDLADIFGRLSRSVGRGFKNLGKGVLYILFFFVKNWILLTVSLFIGVGISYLLKFSSSKFYTSEIILRSNTVSNAEMIGYINRLHTFCREKNSDELASALSINRDEVYNIKDIKAFWIIDQGFDNIPDYIDFRDRHSVLDTINVRMRDRFAIRVKTSNPHELSGIRNGIIYYINNNQFYRDQNELRLRHYNDLLIRINYEVEQLDSLQKVKYFEESRRLMPKEGGQMIFLQDYQTQLLHNDISELITRKQEIERNKTIYAELITILNDFTPPFRPKNGLLYYGKIIIPVIFFMTIILIILIRNRNTLEEAYKMY
ncbi:MAG TPA: hypothetical protein DDW27_13405 [Bacteroidales bacterium]|nr:hypothetical protein [Bacteroidales bacterium]